MTVRVEPGSAAGRRAGPPVARPTPTRRTDGRFTQPRKATLIMSLPWRTDGSVDLYIDASPAAVFAHISDVSRIGERSPECRRAEWLPGSTPAGQVGARFRGHNRSGLAARWSRVCEVVDAVPGRSFAFRTVPERSDPSRRDSTAWSYTLTAEGTGTRVTHSYEIIKLPSTFFRVLYGRLLPQHRDMRPQMLHSLGALKATLERSSVRS
jgi:hypothetical protein